MNYYNEFDPFAAGWLRELIKAGLIPPGDVDDRSIKDVQAGDLRGYTQCHFFAGIGGWPLALQLAGWPASRSVWTGSCPCQPFSAAGKGEGFNDERHLWPDFYRLIRECNPAIVFGEQVASKATDEWLDLVQLDVETLGYAFGCVAFPAAGIGAPHIRDRAYWVADSTTKRHNGWWSGEASNGRNAARQQPERLCDVGGMVYTLGAGLEGFAGHGNGSSESRWLDAQSCGSVTQAGGNGGLADPMPTGRPEGWPEPGYRSTAGCGEHGGLDNPAGARHTWSVAETERDTRDETRLCVPGVGCLESDGQPSPLHGFWADADWLLCRDGKWRPVEPGTFPLAHGVSNRVGKLRGYGNAIVAPQAAEFIMAFMECAA